METEKQTLWVVTDSSGSMLEMGKMMVCFNLLSYLRDKLSLYKDSIFYDRLNIVFLNNEAELIECGANQGIPSNEAKGEFNVKSLLALMAPFLEDVNRSEIGKELRMLLLTDGNIPKKEKEIFVSWKNNSKVVTVRAVAVGPDANINVIKELSTEGKVFLPENIAHSLLTWPSTFTPKGELPDSLEKIEVPATPAGGESAEEEDEW